MDEYPINLIHKLIHRKHTFVFDEVWEFVSASMIVEAGKIPELHAVLPTPIVVRLARGPEVTDETWIDQLPSLRSSNPAECTLNRNIVAANPYRSQIRERGDNEVVFSLCGDGGKMTGQAVECLLGSFSNCVVKGGARVDKLVVVSVGREQDRGGVCEVKRISEGRASIEQAQVVMKQ